MEPKGSLQYSQELEYSILYLRKEFRKYGQFACKILVICHTALLWTSRVLHTELSLGMSLGSHYVQWSSFCHSVNMSILLSNYALVEKRAIIDQSAWRLGYGLDDRDSRSGRWEFFSWPQRRDGLWAHPASYPMGTRSSFHGDKAAGAWSWPLISI
jgi:hypothetical protein